MFMACWSVKGGSGTSVVAASLALLEARRGADVLLVDLAGDQPAVLALREDGPGLAQWIEAGDAVPADGLARIEVPVTTGLSLIRRGDGPLRGTGATLLQRLLAYESRSVVVDCGSTLGGSTTPDVAHEIASSAGVSVLVLRPCYLALRRAMAAPIRATGVVAVGEEGRALDAQDMADVLQLPILAEIISDPAVARAVDAGLLATRLPRSLERSLRRVPA